MNCLVSLHIFHDSVESHSWGLSLLGKSEHLYGDILVPILMGKLSPENHINLACDHSNTLWILADLMVAILKEIQDVESGLYDSHNVLSRSTVASFHINSQDYLKKQCQDNTDGKKK